MAENEPNPAPARPFPGKTVGEDNGNGTGREPAPPRRTRRNPDPAPIWERLKSRRMHPVMLFGTRSSGKSMLLMSLFQAIRNDAEVAIELDEPLLAKGHPDRDELHGAAETFFHRAADRFDDGLLPQQTIEPKPFFIPIRIQGPRDSEPVRFAFLESMGEWYEPQPEPEGEDRMPLHPELKREIRQVVANYAEPASYIYAAPYSTGDGIGINARDCAIGLTGALRNYGRHVQNREKDFHLFLLTKWDQVANPMAGDAGFGWVEPDTVRTLLDDRFRQPWSAFCAMPQRTEYRRFFMQYSAAHIVEDRVGRPPDAFAEFFARYPRTVWNWLYGNALQENALEGRWRREKRPVLFRDVMPPVVPRVTISQRITEIFTFRRTPAER